MTISSRELADAIESALQRGFSEGEIAAALAGLAAQGVRSKPAPICDECSEEMHRYDNGMDSGWCCDLCGWSWDD